MAIPILLYHHIDVPPPSGTPSRSNYVKPENFEKQMVWLKRLGYQGLSLVEAMPYISGQSQGKVAVITFDDGFLSVFENAMPILNSLQFSATNYFVANRLGQNNAWDVADARRAPIMTKEQVRIWLQNGHEVGSHTCDHVHLTKVSIEEARQQIFNSKSLLEKLTGETINSFAYPYGDECEAVRVLVADAGYKTGVTTRRGRAKGDENAFELPRHSVRRNDTLLHFLAKCLLR